MNWRTNHLPILAILMMQGKVALEEHVVLPTLSAPGAVGSPPGVFEAEYFADVRRRLGDTSLRLEDMDRFGIETMVLSLSQPGVQGIVSASEAVDAARRLNDELAEVVQRHPRRFAGFAALPMQDPVAAGDELARGVEELGFRGALVNGYSNLGNAETAQYLDEAPVWPFWERAAALGVPVYLHPRDPLVTQRRIYEGYPALVGSAWGFGVETATHALRLMLSGLFDRFPGLTIIVGHLGEGLPFLLPRVEHRLRHVPGDLRGRQSRPLMSYLRSNFFITTSGAFRTAALLDTLLEVGADRVLFSVDYPYENMQEQSEWFEALPISDADRAKIGRDNARRLLEVD
jgi:predicted TIM-barrel fold metal-dependent hydrolase